MWQDVLDSIMAGRPGEASCPYCKHKPLLVEEVEFATKISCAKCGRYIQGKFGEQY
jgi:hypothetical protein